MTKNDIDEPTCLWLSHLQVLEPDSARAERVRARCRAALIARQHHAEKPARQDGFTAVILQPALVGGLSLSYLLGVVYDVLRLHAHP